MSEASRARRQRWLNVREELAWREGRALEAVPGRSVQTPASLGDTAQEESIDPSWGPVGSLAKQLLTPEEYAHLMELHNQMLQRARARTAAEAPGEAQDQPPPVETSKEPPAQNRVLARSEGPQKQRGSSW